MPATVRFQRPAPGKGSVAKILMLTALASGSHRRKALEAGADEFLTKPFIPMALLDRVRGLLAARSRSGASLPGHGQEQARLQFVNALCHELRTPLTPVLASAGALREVLHPEPKSVEAKLLNNILAGAENLRTRIDELLDIAVFQSGAYRLNLTGFDSMALLKETCAFLEPEAARRGQYIIADIPDTLPQLRADRARLQQVLLNLVTNAMKFSPEGSSIEVRATAQDQSLTIEVIDQGKGLSSEEQDRLFQPYFRAEQDRQRCPGLGLRVALCRQIVEAHGGGMWVETGAGLGNSFRVSLPLERVWSDQKKRREGS